MPSRVGIAVAILKSGVSAVHGSGSIPVKVNSTGNSPDEVAWSM